MDEVITQRANFYFSRACTSYKENCYTMLYSLFKMMSFPLCDKRSYQAENQMRFSRLIIFDKPVKETFNTKDYGIYNR